MAAHKEADFFSKSLISPAAMARSIIYMFYVRPHINYMYYCPSPSLPQSSIGYYIPLGKYKYKHICINTSKMGKIFQRRISARFGHPA
ncbi:protein of unknown function [Agrobacterium pusense]|uniref:Uncharacterized protein n=1 Tax=Agrobacterium pusense TaxID=648995 RepID=U4QB98_9HYPH|nr:protein of unknown function [Agrobacterium pusense]